MFPYSENRAWTCLIFKDSPHQCLKNAKKILCHPDCQIHIDSPHSPVNYRMYGKPFKLPLGSKNGMESRQKKFGSNVKLFVRLAVPATKFELFETETQKIWSSHLISKPSTRTSTLDFETEVRKLRQGRILSTNRDAFLWIFRINDGDRINGDHPRLTSQPWIMSLYRSFQTSVKSCILLSVAKRLQPHITTHSGPCVFCFNTSRKRRVVKWNSWAPD